MQDILEKEYCTGCEACLNACTHQAIYMKQDREGFNYPYIEQSRCIDCGLCKMVCPVIHYDDNKNIRHANNDIQQAYAAKTTNENWREVSSSGGIFPALANYILKNKGIVVGAAFDEEYNVYHKIINSVNDLKDIQSSKYVQSSIGTVFREIKNELQTDKLVLFAGMACQVEGLKNYLGKEYRNLYTIDLICMGIPSPGVWRAYLDTNFKGETIKNINFKDKTYGWHTFSLRIESKQRLFLDNGMENDFFQCMFKTYSLRPSCFTCPYKKEERWSDFTLADCWGTSREVPHLDDNKGLSSVIIHSKKGFDLWNKINDNIVYEVVTINSIAKNNDNLVRNRKPAHDRNLFYNIFNNVSPQKAFSKFGKAPNYGIKYTIEDLSHKLFKKLKKCI